MRRLYSPLGLLAAFLAGAVLAGAVAGIVVGLAQPRPAAPVQPAADSNPDIKLILTPGLLTSLVQQSIAAGQSPIPLRHAQVSTSPGKLTVQGDLGVAGQLVPASVDFQPALQDGHLAMQVTGAHLASLPIPRDIGGLAEGPINRELAAATSGLPATIVSANTTSDGLEVIARLNPAARSGLHETARPAPANSSGTPVRATPTPS